MSAWIEEIVHQVIHTLGYGGIVALMVIECLFPPIPSELIVPLAGFTSVRGDTSFWLVCVYATLGSVIGALLLYYLGKLVGGERLLRWTDSYGMWVGISSNDVRRSISWFDKYGAVVVFFGRFIPGIRSLISIPAGVTGMALIPFTIYTTLGSAIWVIVLAYMGRLLGANYEIVGQYIDPVSDIILIVMVALGLLWVLYRLVSQRAGLAGKAPRLDME